MNDIKKLIEMTGWSRKEIIKAFGLTRQRLNRWKNILDSDSQPTKKIPTRILPEEEEIVFSYRTLNDGHRDLGYRKFTWQMVDNDIAYMSESSVYRVLKRFKLLGKTFKPHDGALKEYENKPKRVHHHWHTDLAYVKLSGEHYYLVFLMDGYSRYILDWELLPDMLSKSVELFTLRVIEKYPDAEPMIIHDNGVQFISLDFKNILSENNCIDVPTRVRHPETNGKAERFVGLVRQEALRPQSPAYYSEAKRVIGKYVDEYNNHRYHAGLKFLKPIDVFEGRAEQILEERKKKLAFGRKMRQDINKQKFGCFSENIVNNCESLPAY